MQHLYYRICTYIAKILIGLAILVTGLSSYSQVTPELVFKNPSRSGAAGAIGTVYKFDDVTTGIDALVKISDRSSSKVTLTSIDLTSSGYGNAFQPQVSYNDGDAPKNTTWWMEFTITFVKSTDNRVVVPVSSFNVTALDMDGDDDRLREQVTFYGLSSYTLDRHTDIDVSSVTNGKVFTGSSEDYTNINTGATNIMVTNTYVNTSSFKVRVGGVTGNRASDGSERMSSLWFKSFVYDDPINSTLPVSLISFRARKDNDAVVLDWATSMEKNFSNFVVQRSTDGNSFDDIATVFSDENNSTSTISYTFTDKKTTQGAMIYYRLKMVDIDAKYTYSEVRTIRTASDQGQASIVVYPNPTVNDLRVTIPAGWQNKRVTYSVFTSSGTIVKQKISGQASQTETLDLSSLKTGLYIVKVATANESTVKQFSKQN